MQYTPPTTPPAHAESHMHGGSDPVATATPEANGIPKADGSGHVASGWLDGVGIPAIQTVADMAARHALTTAFQVKQSDNGHIYCYFGGDITNEENWLDQGQYNVAPSNTAVPTIAGTETVGETLTATAGTFSGYPSPSHAAWQWQRSDTGTGGWVDIEGETSETYLLAVADLAKFLRAKETASNIAGSAAAYSTASGAIASGAPAAPDAPVIDGYWEDVTNWWATFHKPALPENATSIDIYYSQDGGTNWTLVEGSGESGELQFAVADTQLQVKCRAIGAGGYTDGSPTVTNKPVIWRMTAETSIQITNSGSGYSTSDNTLELKDAMNNLLGYGYITEVGGGGEVMIFLVQSNTPNATIPLEGAVPNVSGGSGNGLVCAIGRENWTAVLGV